MKGSCLQFSESCGNLICACCTSICACCTSICACRTSIFACRTSICACCTSIWPAALELLNNPAQSSISVAQWVEYKWRMVWRENLSRFHNLKKDVIPTPPEIIFPRSAWVWLNSLQTGVGLFRSETHKKKHSF